MKKLLLLLGLLLCISSCAPIDQTVYEYTITYTIAGTEITEVHSIDMPSNFVPSYRLDQNSLKIIGSYGTSSMPYTTIYKGSLTVKVTNFEYKVVRNYKASGWNGHEIKTK
jgi:hypothetical protein